MKHFEVQFYIYYTGQFDLLTVWFDLILHDLFKNDFLWKLFTHKIDFWNRFFRYFKWRKLVHSWPAIYPYGVSISSIYNYINSAVPLRNI